ncbi:hypothetical protein NQ314_004873 [Rhamnusium bicolor]|uniref:Uncharacterized protein n=1 Tax=Rhamnusium bicolor TaxID=1586634 RepID=A0AAV8ZLD4_9CUCU|nr:hypothetical protein NQ314_004873 [Rhamnusium bicolor]
MIQSFTTAAHGQDTKLYLYQFIISRFSCALPDHPDNGRWTILNGEGQPRSNISINTILKYDCNIGYKLSAPSQYVICDTNWNPSNLPACEVLCPPIRKEISCQEATDGTYLTYACAEFYETPFGYKKTLTCLDGTWNYPNPVCQPGQLVYFLMCVMFNKSSLWKKVNDDSVPLIFGGTVTEVLEYPWITAVYRKKCDEYENICGGSIISQRVVLTAAHCVTNDNGDVLPEENYLIYRIVVHPSYKGNSRRYLADIAILVTKRSFILNKRVQPVCINDVNMINLHAGSLGEISGWGIKEDGSPSDELRTLKIPYKYETTCAQELPPDWANKYNSIDKICAGFFNKSISICKGDSGNGLFFRNPDDNRYYVHGIVSLGVSHKGECDIQQNSLYTKVAFYYEYLDRELSKYSIKDCLLPVHPKNGKWIIENENKEPGDIVPSNTVLKINCNPGYHMFSGSTANIKCDSSYKMPKCQLTCEQLEVPPSAVFYCQSKTGEKINCAEATDLTTLTYTCSDGFTIPLYGKNTTQCINGRWMRPLPRCVRIETSTKAIIKKRKETRKIICVYDSWRYHTGVKPTDFNASLCTHVTYEIGLSPDGNLKIRDNALAAGVNKSFYERVTDMKNDNKNLKVILSVEGDGDTEFRVIAANASIRNTFINNTIRFLHTYNFDGLDINWHYPSIKPDRQRGWLLTATVYISPVYLGYPYEMDEYLDWINLQTYDMYSKPDRWTGQYSALFASSKETLWNRENSNIDQSVKNWRGRVKKIKLFQPLHLWADISLLRIQMKMRFIVLSSLRNLKKSLILM